MANRFLNNITINDEYTLPAADGTADQVLTTDGAGQLVFVDQDTISSGSAEVVEVPVKNLQGSALTKGDPVYISGSVGASGRLEVQLADAGNSAKMPAVGLLKQDLAINGEGFAVVTGKLKNLVTSPIDGVTPSEGDVVYVKSGGSTGAALTTTKPTGASNLIQNMGKVGRVSTAADGTYVVSSILRSNDVPNLNTGKIWVGQGNTIESSIVFLDEPNGRMGIGTTSPAYLLDVAGTQRVSGELRIGANINAYQGDASIWVPNVGQALTVKQNTGNVGIGTTSPSQKLDVDGAIITEDYRAASVFYLTSGGDWRFRTDTGIERVRITSAGNVGIGETLPDKKLEVSGDIKISGGDYNGLYFENAGGTTKSLLYQHASYDALVIKDVVNNADRFTFTNSGNFGIGTTSPTVKLDVRGTMLVSGDTPDARIGSTLEVYRNGSTAELSIHQDDASASSTFSQLRFRNGGNDTYLKVPPNGQGLIIDTENKANALVISTFGDLGIGNTSPTQKLHVTGNARITGAYYDSNNSAGTSGQVLSSTATGTDWVSLSEIQGVDGTGTANYIAKWSDADTITNSVIYDNGTNIGIGTTNLYARLSVKATSHNNGISVNRAADTTAALYIGNDGGNNAVLAANNADMVFGRDLSGTFTERMRLTNGGNLGIGTTSVAMGLHVADTKGALFGPTTGASMYISPNNENTINGGYGLDTDTGDLWLNYRGYLNGFTRFRDTRIGDGKGNAIVMVDGSSGNVGIGSTAPAAKLNVASTGANAYSSTITKGTNMKGIINALSNNADDMVGIYFGTGTTTEGTHWSGITGSRSQSATDWSTQLNFYTHDENFLNINDATQKMVIKGSGNVGIGTTGPSYKLDVAGTSRSDLHIFRSNQSAPTADAFIFRPADNTVALGTANAERMRIDSSGNVGIGNTSPGSFYPGASNLVIGNGSQDTAATVFAGSTTTAYYLFAKGTSGTDRYHGQVRYNFSADTMEFAAGGGTGAKFIIKSTGVIQIPTLGQGFLQTDSSGNISISGGGTLPGGPYLPLSAGSGAGLTGQLWFTGTTDSNRKIFFTNAGTYAKGSMDAASYGFQVSGSEKLTIDSSGNVGIGTTNPSHKLHIEGGVLKVQGDNSTDGTAVFIANSAKGTNQSHIHYGSTGDWYIRSSSTSGEVVLQDLGGNVGIGTASPQSKLHVAQAGNANGGSILMGLGGSGTSKWSFLAGTHYNQATGSGNGSGSAGVAAIGVLSTNTYNRVYIGGGPYEINPATQIEFWTYPTTTHNLGGTQRGYVDSGGNWFLGNTLWIDDADDYVGIGTTSPSAPLHIYQPSTSGLKFSRLNHDDIDLSLEGANRFVISNTTDGLDIMSMLYDTGNVGIGTTSPVEKLVIASSVNNDLTTLRVENNFGSASANGTGTALQFYGWDAGITANIKSIRTGQSYSPSALTFETYGGNGTTGTNSLSERMRIDDFGNVGIGTTSPATKLEVSGITTIRKSGIATPHADTDLLVTDATAAASTAQIEILGGNAGASTLKFADTDSYTVGSIDYSHVANSMSFRTNNSIQATITSAGNVGIGNTSPGYHLSVNGAVQTDMLRGYTYPTLSYLDFDDDNLPNGNSVSLTSVAGMAFVIDSNNNATTDAFYWKVDGTTGTGSTIMTLADEGALQLNNYGSGTFTGTATQRLAVDSSGNVIEIPIGSGAVDGTGTANYIAKWSDADTITNSAIYDNGGTVTIGSTQQGWSGNQLNVGSTSNGASGINILTSTTGNAYIIFSDVVDGTATEYANQIRFSHTDNFLSIKTVGSERLRIDSSGNVGIGTTNPYGRLNVIPSSNPTSPTAANQITVGESSSNSLYNLRLGYFLEGGAYKGSIQAIAGNTPNTLVLNGDGGNVGIGTTSPSQILHLEASGTNPYLRVTETGNTGIDFGQETNGNGLINLRDSAALRIFTSSTERMRITNTGNVAIGDTTSNFKLKVQTTGWNGIQVNSTTTSGAVLNLTTTQRAFELASRDNSFQIRDLTAGDTSRLTINSSGNVGIGRTPVAAALEVEGQIRVTGTSGYTFNAGGDTDGGMFSTADGTINFRTNGSERMRIDSSGNVMIGNTSAAAKLDIRQDSGVAIRCEDGTGGYFVVNQGGDTGIGTTNPAEKLTVSGDSNITGKLAVGSSAAHGTYDFYNQNTAYFNGAVTVDDTITVTNLTYEATTSSGDYHGEIVYFGSGTLTAGGLYVLGNSSGTLVWSPAQDSTPALATGLLAIALGTSVSSGLLVRGHAQNSNWGLGWTVGDKLYLSPTAGSISNSLTTGSNDFVRIIGYYLGSNKIYFCPDNTFVQNVA